MSTRSMVIFHGYEGRPDAFIYQHSDGYPGTWDGEEYGVLPDLQKFFDQVKEQCSGSTYGTRFDDSEYLAAKFVVWQAMENGKYAVKRDFVGGEYKAVEEALPLNFGSLGVSTEIHGDCEYTYHIWTEHHDQNGFPLVSWAEYPYDGKGWTMPTSPGSAVNGSSSGPGTYRVRLATPTADGATEFIWECKHFLHARNRAAKRGLDVESIELIEEA